jgi:ABC transporter substrate binding protein (PQQ-dependent alcohol dehydrogenase system)
MGKAFWVCALFLLSLPARAAELGIGFISLADDPRYEATRLLAQDLGQPTGRPLAGAELAIAESRAVARNLQVEFALHPREIGGAEEGAATVRALAAAGARFVLLDLPGPVAATVAAATADENVLLFNISADADALRGAACRPHLLHTIPSAAMQADALAQLLKLRKWHDVLALAGLNDEDTAQLAAFRRAAQRFALRIVAERRFVRGSDPREREANNPLLLTGNAGYDVVFVADTDGEFARYLPYRTQRPRPVVGASGLAALAWHPLWERHGAPQLNLRFQRLAGRPMGSVDWAAWVAVKAVVEAALRTRATDFATLRDFLRGDQLTVDGFKGTPSSFRPWDGQLRQPLLLATANAVVERAPVEGFLHASNNLDTLGYDKPETLCREGRR